MKGTVKIKEGAERHLKERGYWFDYYDGNLDGKLAVIAGDYTDISEYPHYSLDVIGADFGVGLSADFFEVNQ